MKVHRGQQHSKAQFLVDPMGSKLGPLYPSILKLAPTQLLVLVKPSLPVGHPDLLTLLLLTPVHPFCSGPAVMGDPQRILAAGRGCLLGAFA